jgi:mannose-6-phosphate isomerase-like protein (cupin superfamily)
MKNVKSFIESGILEMYVLGFASDEEIKEVQQMCATHAEVRAEVENICYSLKTYAEAGVEVPNSTIKPMILGSIDYMERLQKGEKPTFPPVLNEKSTAADYSQWLDRKDMVLPTHFDDIYVKLIGYTPQVTCGIVWIKRETPYEVHDTEHEKFLILEGTCDIVIDGKVHALVPGDYMSIPLHAGHTVKVTSKTPCKVILQRVAA